MKSILKKSTAFFLAISILFGSVNVKAGEITLPSGTVVYLETTQSISSKTATYGQIVNFRVKEDVVIDKQTVIESGTTAYGQITTVQKARGIGKPGTINVQLTHLEVEGTKVPLTANLANEGEDKKIIAIVVGIVVCLPVLALKGGEGEIPPGYSVTASVAKTVTLQVK